MLFSILSKPEIKDLPLQAWHAWAVMNFEAVLHYKHQNQGRDEKKKLRHASGASANSEASNSDSEADSTEHSPVPSPGQKKVNEVRNKVLCEACVQSFSNIHLYCISK